MRPVDFDEKQRERLLDKYRKHKELGRMLFRDKIKYIPREGLFKAAKKLGLTSGKTLVIGSDEEQAIAVDYTFFNEYGGKFNAIDRYVNLSESEYCPNIMTGHVAMFVENRACSTGSLIPLRERSTIELFEQTVNKYLRFAKSNTQPVFSNNHAASFQADVQRVELKHNSLAGIAYE